MTSRLRRAVTATALFCGLLGLDASRAQNEPPPVQPDILITGTTIADVEGKQFLKGQTIAIRSGRIAYAGPASPAWQSAVRIIDGSDFVALPGFVDTHTHLWQHVARGLEPAGRLQDWAPAVYRLSHHALPGDVHDLTRAAAGQALLNGITSVSDFASINFAENADAETVAALKELHIGGAVVWWRPAVFLPPKLQDRQLASLVKAAGPTLTISVGFGPLSFMPVPLVYDGVQTALRNHLRMTEHQMENMTEARQFAEAVAKYLADTKLAGAQLSPADAQLLASVNAGPPMPKVDALMAMSRTRDDLLGDPAWSTDLSPTERQALGALPDFAPPSQLALLDAWGALDGFLAIHSVWPTVSDIALYQKHGAAISHNPESNMYLSSGVAPLRRYRDAGIPVTLGTDGAASNDHISMFDAMRTAWLLQKVSTLQPDVTRSLDAWFFLQAATINGARALGIADRTGTIAVGKEADILLLDQGGLSAAPAVDATAAARLVTSAEARDIAYVIADGNIMVEHGRLAGIDESTLAHDLTRIAAVLQDRETNGKIWSEMIPVQANAAEPVERYRLIRKPDTVGLQLTNVSGRRLTISVAFSGTTFGGKTPMTMRPESLARFPMASPPTFGRYEIRLAPHETLTITKPAGSLSYSLQTVDRAVIHESVAQEQVAIWLP